MKHHTIIGRLGPADTVKVSASRADSHETEINFVDGEFRPGYGLGQALDQLCELGLRPSETAVDLALLAAAITAADTRISRAADAQDAWTREIDLHLPVHDVARWSGLASLIVTTLNFLTGDRWGVHFRPRAAGIRDLAPKPTRLRTTKPTTVCLFSGGLDSFIGAIDLLTRGEVPMLVSHYWDGITSTHQTYCAERLNRRFTGTTIHHIRARVGFPTDTVEPSTVEDTLRGRSFLFFALAVMAADAVGGNMVVQVPENGLISLNVPLDPLRLGALSTRTTHPFYMARFGDLLNGLGLSVRLENPYAFMTKGQMQRVAPTSHSSERRRSTRCRAHRPEVVVTIQIRMRERPNIADGVYRVSSVAPRSWRVLARTTRPIVSPIFGHKSSTPTRQRASTCAPSNSRSRG